MLEDIGGQRVKGYRAASFSIDSRTLWAFDVLAEEGYDYSSSIYPIRHDHYGMPDASRFRFRPSDRHALVEVPISTLRLRGRNLPSVGGGYFPLMPSVVSRWALPRIARVSSQPPAFYFHPLETHPGQPPPGALPPP